MYKILAVTVCAAVLLGAGGWYFVLRPPAIRKDCAKQASAYNNYERNVSRKATDKFLMDSFGESDSTVENNWQDLQDSAETTYTGAYDKAYSSCLHEHGL